MATPYKIQLGPNHIGNFHKGPYNAEAAAKVSEVLQKNLENWTIIFEGLKHSMYYHQLSNTMASCLQRFD